MTIEEKGVVTEVAEGIVVLTGTVGRRSALPGLLERVEAVDDVTIAYRRV